jgi:proliferating cell nuclear antigen
MRAPDEGGFVTFVFESPTETKVSDYEIRLLDLDQDQLAIPDTDYAAVVKLPSAELQRIVKDLSQFGDSIVVTASKEGVSFSADGDIGVTGNVKLAQSVGSDGEEAVTVELQEPISLTFACRCVALCTQCTVLQVPQHVHQGGLPGAQRLPQPQPGHPYAGGVQDRGDRTHQARPGLC